MKGKSNKVRYNLHLTRFQHLVTNKKLIKAIKERFGGITPEDIYRGAAEQATILQDSLGHRCGAEELYWIHNGKKTIFLTDNLIQMLARAKFTMSDNATIEPIEGFESFTIAVPKNTFVTDEHGNKIEIRPFLMSCLSVHDSIKKIQGNYKRVTGCDSVQSVDLKKDVTETVITVTYESNEISYQTTEKVSNILNVLRNGLRDNSTLHSYQLLDDAERLQSQMMIRIATAFLIYTNAKGGDNIQNGYPNDCFFDIEKGFTRAFWDAAYSDVPARKKRPQNTGDLASSGHKQSWNVRSAHLKNLSHERFYQGEHAWRPRGSRWILVDEYEAGEQIDAHHSK
ncbi:hypothetical protein OTK49_02355 [Vibrio coralliirubri]|uniref:hypothetical protein n=1 Tax=Vibrio coralliirubri TaxID=1516159 RepID=UPI0022837D92|nr:hypothetical protein [Vibrio coralliirubri]MCY9861358.1 hypothetical protein [Vibrio coralliirubri]